MIIGSLLLILVAVGLLVAGVLGGSNALIIASIATTVVAAVVLILGVRQSTSDEDDYADDDGADAARLDRVGGRFGRGGVWRGSIPSQARWRRGRDAVDTASHAPAGDTATGGLAARDATGGVAVDAATRVMVAEPTREEAIVGRVPDEPIAEMDDEMDDDPPGEPAAAITSPADAARIATLATEVLVVDGRPRYHVPSCVHLLGRESEPLPVGEALELGFSPCGMCEPDRAVLAEARPV